MSYRDYLKWQDDCREKAEAMHLHATLRRHPIISEFSLPDPKNPRDRFFRPNGEAEIVCTWDKKGDKQRQVALRLIRIFSILYQREEESEYRERFESWYRRIGKILGRWGVFIWALVVAPSIALAGMVYLHSIMVYSFAELYAFLVWDWDMQYMGLVARNVTA
ncbi:hypothetical protein TWF281_006699 [Arthrobotrys megalospora]